MRTSVGAQVVTFMRQAQWSWAALGALIMWLVMGMVTSRLTLSGLFSTAVSASFLAVPALGQMIVVTTGRGAIDLSIPGMITLAAFLATGIIDGQDALLPVGLLVCLGLGALVGLVNALTVIYLRIPAIIATLGVGYLLNTLSLIYNQGFAAFRISPALLTLTRGRLLGIPLIILFTVALGLVLAHVLNRSSFGYQLAAVGQNIRAAALAGVRVNKIQIVAYVCSGLLAALGGVLASARVGGAFLGMGDSYLLETVGSVVIGGTFIAGGRATVAGTLFGALFLILLDAAMQVAGLPIGAQNIVKGGLIIAVLIGAHSRADA